jgi:hypothetical protein
MQYAVIGKGTNLYKEKIMSNSSDRELQQWIQFHPILDYTDEEVQKKVIVNQDHGATVTLYDWIHRYDTAGAILDAGWMDEYTGSRLKEFRRGLMEELNK